MVETKDGSGNGPLNFLTITDDRYQSEPFRASHRRKSGLVFARLTEIKFRLKGLIDHHNPSDRRYACGICRQCGTTYYSKRVNLETMNYLKTGSLLASLLEQSTSI